MLWKLDFSFNCWVLLTLSLYHKRTKKGCEITYKCWWFYNCQWMKNSFTQMCTFLLFWSLNAFMYFLILLYHIMRCDTSSGNWRSWKLQKEVRDGAYEFRGLLHLYDRLYISNFSDFLDILYNLCMHKLQPMEQ